MKKNKPKQLSIKQLKNKLSKCITEKYIARGSNVLLSHFKGGKK